MGSDYTCLGGAGSRSGSVGSGGVGCAGEVGWDGMVWVGHEKELTLDLLPEKETEHHSKELTLDSTPQKKNQTPLKEMKSGFNFPKNRPDTTQSN